MTNKETNTAIAATEKTLHAGDILTFTARESEIEFDENGKTIGLVYDELYTISVDIYKDGKDFCYCEIGYADWYDEDTDCWFVDFQSEAEELINEKLTKEYSVKKYTIKVESKFGWSEYCDGSITIDEME